MPCAVLLAALGALLAAAPALGGNGGIAPVEAQSPNADAISDAYWAIFAVAAFVFVVVEATLVVFLVKYRRRRRARDAEGPQVRGNTNLEIAWTIVPVLLLAAITSVVFVLLPEIEDAPPARAGQGLEIRVEGHQYYWQFVYPGGQIAIDRMVVPVGQVVNLTVVASDVVHSWWIPSLGGKIDAIPGRTNYTWFQAERRGVFKGQCAELCGLQHAAMLASVEVVSAAAYRRFLAAHKPSNASTVGKETFEGVCAKCHGLEGQGTEAAPAIAGRTFDQTTVELIRNGGIRMPAVGANWSDAQMDATIAYLNQSIGAQSGG
jgi:cytochrome c oxidase subunit 2